MDLDENFRTHRLRDVEEDCSVPLLFGGMHPAMATLGGQFEHLQHIYPYYQILAWPLAHIVQLVSVWMMVLVAGNRYVAVCHPLHASSLCSRRHIRWQIIAMVTACVVYSLPRFAEFRSV